MRRRFLCLCAVLAGCTSAEAPLGSTFPPADATTDTRTADDAGVDTSVVDTATEPTDTAAPPVDSDVAEAPQDTAADTAESGPPPGPVDCLSGSFGPSSYTLVDLFYQVQVGGCTSSACSDFVMFDPTCAMTLQVSDVKYTATLDASDCELFKRWLTSDLLVTYLRDTVTCYYGKDGSGTGPGAYEDTSISLADGRAAKKTWSCPNEPFKSHRNCINVLRAKYFPGK